MSLAILATEENWQGFDEAWNALITSDGPVDELLDALGVVGSKRRIARCMSLVREHADKLVQAGRPAEAALLMGAALRGGGPVNELGDGLFQHAKTAWGEEPWWEPFLEISAFEPGSGNLRQAWVYFDDMRSYDLGSVIYHAAGWGVGEVTRISHTDMEVEVRFQSGRTDRFPLRTAVEIFERLPQSDLRTQLLRDPDGLKKRLKKEPLEILRSILMRHGGKATSVNLRNALMQIGVTGTSWSSWWKKTRLLAENSEWFRVSGNATRAELELLRRAVDPVEGLKRQLSNVRNLKEALSRVRDLWNQAKVEEPVRLAALEAVETLAADASEPLEHRLAAWMLLREHRGETPELLREKLETARDEEPGVDPSVPPALWKLMQCIPGVREQEKSFALLQEVHGEGWMDAVADHLAHASPGLIAPLIDAFIAADRHADLARTYALLLARPTRTPFVLIALAKAAESGRVKGLEADDFPTPTQRAQALSELAVYLEDARRGNAQMTRAQQRLTDVLTKGEKPLLRKLLKDADNQTLAVLRGMLQRGLDDKVDAMITDIAIEHGFDIFAAGGTHFWQEDRIWTTRSGLQRREAELRELRETKLPENAEALARAASYGDLSENSEWENAIEEQRHLTEQAAQIERELRQAALLENAPIPDDTVCPGTYVRYREVGSGQEHRLDILGPWDTGRSDTVSYRAPLAQGMMGLHPGERATIELPSGPLEVEVLESGLAAIS